MQIPQIIQELHNRRHTLNTEQQAILDEFARRNNINLSGVAVELPKAAAALTPEGTPEGGPFDVVEWAAKSAAGGTLKMTREATTLPFDLAGQLGSEKSNQLAKLIRQKFPKVPADTAMQELGQTLVQYSIPAGGAVKVVNRALVGVPSAYRFIMSALAGGLADISVASPEDTTIGDVLNYGPTQTKKTDTPFERRVKVGVEGATVATAIGVPVVMGKELWQLGKNVMTSLRPSKLARNAVEKVLREQAIDPEKAIAQIDHTLNNLAKEGFQPTAGTASDDIGLIALEKGRISHRDSSALFNARREQNMRNISDSLEKVALEMGGDPELARKTFQKYINDLIETGEDTLEGAERALEAARFETDNFVDEFTSAAGMPENASVGINQTVKDELKRITIEKNRLFAAIDPHGSVIIEKEGLRDFVKELLKPQSTLDLSPQKVGKIPIIKKLRQALSPKNKKPLTYKALQHLRPELSEAIAKARAAEEGGVVGKLLNLKRAVDDIAGELAEGSSDVAERAAEAMRYYKEEYVPKFKEFTGKQFKDARIKGTPIPPTTTGKRFLKASTGTTESAKQLRSIIEGATNAEDAMPLVREHFIGEVADLLRGETGKKAVNKLQAYLSNRQVRESLNAFPEVRAEITEYLGKLKGGVERQTLMGEEVLRAKEQLNLTQKATQKSAAKYFVDNEPIRAVSRVFSSGDPEKAMDELVQLARKDISGDALKGLRVATSQYLGLPSGIQGRFRGGREVGGALEVLQSAVSGVLEHPPSRKALAKLYSPQEMKTITLVKDQLRLMDKINRQATAGSPTAQLSSLAQQSRIVIASMYGIVKGRGIFQISQWILNALGQNPITKAQALLTDAMLDPELAKTLLAPAKTDVAKKKIAMDLKRHLVNNFTFEEKE